jgi:tRNA-specific 2-thiouridylase
LNEASRLRGASRPSVVVGLSSGVDSSVTAWLLKQQGYNVVGVTLALAEPGSSESSSPSLMGKAKGVADHLGIPHYAVDNLAEFRTLVVDYFVQEYAAGRTPNPCSKCNSRVRFGALVEVARRLGADYVATGHYAQMTGDPKRLSRGVDQQKDQSYVLAEVDPGLLERCIFPLGGLTKQQVRAIAVQNGLAALVSEESQEICFVPHDDYRAFLRDKLGERPGTVVDEAGTILGHHLGTYNYTIGQRKGLGFASGGRPLYVTRVDARRALVVAGPEPCAVVEAISFSVSAVQRTPPTGRVLVQLRSMGEPVEGRLSGPDRVVLDQATNGVAPGQTLVVYDGDDVVLGATITCTEAGAS